MEMNLVAIFRSGRLSSDTFNWVSGVWNCNTPSKTCNRLSVWELWSGHHT